MKTSAEIVDIQPAQAVENRESLDEEVQKERYQALLLRIQRLDPRFQAFDSWSEIISLLRCRTTRRTRKDGLRWSILTLRSMVNLPGWETVLLAIF